MALLQILLREMYGLQPRLIDYEAREHVAENRPLPWPEAMLLIGDKVVSDSPPAIRYPTQLDLGELWFRHTGRPFVFAAWMARKGEDHRAVVTAARALDRQRRLNALRIDSIISRHARGHGWPEDLARTYSSKRLVYRFGDEERAAMECFFDKAHEHRLIDAVRTIELLDSSSWCDSESHHQDPA